MAATVDVRAPTGEAVWFAGVKERGYLNRAGVQARALPPPLGPSPLGLQHPLVLHRSKQIRDLWSGEAYICIYR